MYVLRHGVLLHHDVPPTMEVEEVVLMSHRASVSQHTGGVGCYTRITKIKKITASVQRTGLVDKRHRSHQAQSL